MRVTEDFNRSVEIVREPPLQSVLLLVFVGIVGIQAAPPALSSVGRALAVSNDQVGLVMTAFFLPAAIVLPVAGFAADVYGRRPVALVSLLIYGIAGLATAVAWDFSMLLLLRVIQGIAFPGLVPLSITLAGDFYTGEQGSLAQGLWFSMNGLAAMLTPAVAGILAGMIWYYPFLLSGLALPIAGFVYLFMPEPDRDGGTDSDTQSGIAYLQSYLRSIVPSLRDPSLLVLLIGAFVAYFSRYAVYTFLPLFAVRVLHTSEATGGLLLSIIGATQIIVPLLTGTVLTLISRQRTLLGTLGIMTLVCIGIPMFTDIWVLSGIIGIYGMALSLFVPVLNDTVTAMAPADQRAGVVNAMELCKTLAIALSPAVFGVVLGLAGFTMLFVLAGVLPGLYALIGLLTLNRDPSHTSSSLSR